MNYFGKILKNSIGLNSYHEIKQANELIEKNLKNFIGRFKSDKQVVYSHNFLEKSFISKYGNRGYKVYIPAKRESLPGLIVMLHGCKQDSDDFALGTGMNILAEKENMIVLYPKQNFSYNQNKCWNWFKDEGSSIGESRIIFEMTKAVIKDYNLDLENVYIAGMSAGGAMAVILATQYPDLYKAAGIHSGLPYKAANSINTALYSMKNGRDKPLEEKVKIPMIIFHGDKDEIVAIKNSEQIVNDILSSQDEKILTVVKSTNTYIMTSYKNKNRLVAEYWVLKNKGHVWSGGDEKGSYTSATGPNASKEMMNFFKLRGNHGN